MNTIFILSVLALWQTVFIDGKVSAQNVCCKTLVLKKKLIEKALENHVFQTTKSSNDVCKILCYVDNRCLSYNYGTSSNGDKETCELSESDHVKNNEDLVDRPDTVYVKAENSCSCPENDTCQLGLANNVHECVCKAGTPNITTSTTASPVTASEISSSPSGTESLPLTTTTESTMASLSTNGTLLLLPSTTESAATETTSTTETPLLVPQTTESTLFESLPSTSESLSSTSESLSSLPKTESLFSSPTTTESSLSSPPTTESSLTSPPTTESPLSSLPTTESSLSSPAVTESPSTNATTSQAQATPTPSSDCELIFASPSTSNLIRILNPFSSDLAAFTVSFWLKIPSSSNINLYIFSFATVQENKVFDISIKKDGVMEVVLNNGGKHLQSSLRRDNTWQHFAVTWKSRTGSLALYYNGKSYSSASGLEIGETIVKDGLLIVGQKQDSYDGGFDSDSALQGSLAGLNIWSTELSKLNVSDIYTQNCLAPAGDLQSWTTILAVRESGNSVTRLCPSTC